MLKLGVLLTIISITFAGILRSSSPPSNPQSTISSHPCKVMDLITIDLDFASSCQIYYLLNPPNNNPGYINRVLDDEGAEENEVEQPWVGMGFINGKSSSSKSWNSGGLTENKDDIALTRKYLVQIPLSLPTTVPIIPGTTGNSTIYEEDDDILHREDIRRILEHYSYIWRYFLPVNGILGLTGNIITTAALLKDPTRPRNGFTVYLIALAGADSVSLINSLYYWTLKCVLFREKNTLECRLTAWLSCAAQTSGCLLLAVIGADRLLAVTKPLSTACGARSARKAGMVTAAVYSTALIYYTPYLMWVSAKHGLCDLTLPSRRWVRVYPTLNLAVAVIAPIIVMVYCNGRIAVTLRRRTLDRQCQNNGHTPSQVISNADSDNVKTDVTLERSQPIYPSGYVPYCKDYVNYPSSMVSKEMIKDAEYTSEHSSSTMEHPSSTTKHSSPNHAHLSNIHSNTSNTTIIIPGKSSDTIPRNQRQSPIHNTQPSRISQTSRSVRVVRRRSDRQMFIMLYVVSGMFLLLNLPYHAKSVVAQFLEIRRCPDFRRFVIITYVFLCALYMNNSVNFLLYCVSARKFRAQVARLFRCSNNRVAPK